MDLQDDPYVVAEQELRDISGLIEETARKLQGLKQRSSVSIVRNFSTRFPYIFSLYFHVGLSEMTKMRLNVAMNLLAFQLGVISLKCKKGHEILAKPTSSCYRFLYWGPGVA